MNRRIVTKDDEDRALRELRVRVDLACAVLLQQSMSLNEALSLTHAVKRFALERFPDKEDVFDLIYGSRFRRILSERFRVC